MRARALNGVIAAVVVALLGTGCGGDSTTAGATSPEGTQSPGSAEQQAEGHNQADVRFAQGMIPHHAQAIEMAQLVPERAQSEQVKDLAGRIEQAQGPEIETMTAWLRDWNAPVPPTAPDGMGSGGMDHGGMEQMPGMLDPQQMRQLDQASGADFDRMFLTMMIAHHEGAIEMARDELANGQNLEAQQLAQQIIDTQQAEIQEMRALLPQG